MSGTIVQDHRVFVIATTADETRHALTVSSARAGVHDLPVDDLSVPDPELSDGVVRRLADRLDIHPTITVISGWSLQRLLSVLPSGATVVICGSMNHFVETPEQKIARELSRRQFDVVFLPYVAPQKTASTRSSKPRSCVA
jgi:hypothetical protein